MHLARAGRNTHFSPYIFILQLQLFHQYFLLIEKTCLRLIFSACLPFKVAVFQCHLKIAFLSILSGHVHQPNEGAHISLSHIRKTIIAARKRRQKGSLSSKHKHLHTKECVQTLTCVKDLSRGETCNFL